MLTVWGALALPGLEGVNFTRNSSLIDDLTRAEGGWMIVEPPDRALPVRPALGEVRGFTVLYGRGYRVLEADPFMRMRMHPANSTIHFVVEANVLRPYPLPDVPVTICVNRSVVLDRSARLVRSPYCSEHEFAWAFPRLRFGEELLVHFNETPPTWWAWFGGDPVLGVTPQGIGDGISPCDAITWSEQAPSPDTGTANFSINQSFKWTPNQPAGCNVDFFEWRTNETVAFPNGKVIPTNPVENNSFDCQGVACIQSSPAAGTWYRREYRCGAFGTHYVRGFAQYDIPALGIYNGIKRFTIRTIDCGGVVDPCVPPVAEPFVLSTNCTYVDEVIDVYQYVAIPANTWWAFQNASVRFVT